MSQFSPLPLYSSIKLKIFQFNWTFNRRVWNLFWESIWCSVNLHNEISILFCTLEISNKHPEQSLVVCEKSNQSLDGKSRNSHILTALFTGRGLFTPETYLTLRMTAQHPAAEETGLLARSKFLSYSSSSHRLLCLSVCFFFPEPSIRIKSLWTITVIILFAKAAMFPLHFTLIFPTCPLPFLWKNLPDLLFLAHSQFCYSPLSFIGVIVCPPCFRILA